MIFLSNTKLLMLRVLSCLAHLAPVFAACDSLPEIVFPFIKIFNNDLISAFESILSLFCKWKLMMYGFHCSTCTSQLTNWIIQSLESLRTVNWGFEWFEYYPSPPITVINMVENILGVYDNELLNFFKQNDIKGDTYAWPMLRSLFTEILSTGEWLKLFDHIFSMPPLFMYHFIVSYLIFFRTTLFATKRKEDFHFFFQNMNPCNINKVLQIAYDLYRSSTATEFPMEYNSYEQLPVGQYPIFNRYPKYEVDYQIRQRERIQLEEEELQRSRRNYELLRERTDQLSKEQETWFEKQHAMMSADEIRRRDAWIREQDILRKKISVQEKGWEERLRHITQIEENSRRFMEEQRSLRESQLRRLQEELDRNSFMERTQLRTVIKEEKIKQLEMEAQARLHDLNLRRDLERQMTMLKDEVSVALEQKKSDSKRRVDKWRREDEELELKQQAEREKEQKLNNLNEHMAIQTSLRHSMFLKGLESELELDKLEHERRLKKLAEEETSKAKDQLHRQKEREIVILREQERKYQELMEQERIKRNELQRHRDIMLERKRKAYELQQEIREKRLSDLETVHKLKDLEKKLNMKRQIDEKYAREEEKRMREIVLQYEEDRMRDIELERQIDMLKNEHSEQVYHSNEQTHKISQAVQTAIDKPSENSDATISGSQVSTNANHAKNSSPSSEVTIQLSDQPNRNSRQVQNIVKVPTAAPPRMTHPSIKRSEKYALDEPRKLNMGLKGTIDEHKQSRHLPNPKDQTAANMHMDKMKKENGPFVLDNVNAHKKSIDKRSSLGATTGKRGVKHTRLKHAKIPNDISNRAPIRESSHRGLKNQSEDNIDRGLSPVAARSFNDRNPSDSIDRNIGGDTQLPNRTRFDARPRTSTTILHSKEFTNQSETSSGSSSVHNYTMTNSSTVNTASILSQPTLDSSLSGSSQPTDYGTVTTSSWTPASETTATTTPSTSLITTDHSQNATAESHTIDNNGQSFFIQQRLEEFISKRHALLGERKRLLTLQQAHSGDSTSHTTNTLTTTNTTMTIPETFSALNQSPTFTTTIQRPTRQQQQPIISDKELRENFSWMLSTDHSSDDDSDNDDIISLSSSISLSSISSLLLSPSRMTFLRDNRSRMEQEHGTDSSSFDSSILSLTSGNNLQTTTTSLNISDSTVHTGHDMTRTNSSKNIMNVDDINIDDLLSLSSDTSFFSDQYLRNLPLNYTTEDLLTSDDDEEDSSDSYAAMRSLRTVIAETSNSNEDSLNSSKSSSLLISSSSSPSSPSLTEGGHPSSASRSIPTTTTFTTTTTTITSDSDDHTHE